MQGALPAIKTEQTMLHCSLEVSNYLEDGKVESPY
jgi:hypothetical protein